MSRNVKKTNKLFGSESGGDQDDSADEFEAPKALQKRPKNAVQKAKTFLRKKKMDASVQAAIKQSNDEPKLEINESEHAEIVASGEPVSGLSSSSSGHQAVHTHSGMEVDQVETVIASSPLFSSDSDDIELFDHTYYKREDLVAPKGVSSQTNTSEECDNTQEPLATQNDVMATNETPSSQQVFSISDRDPRCRKRANEIVQIDDVKEEKRAKNSSPESAGDANREKSGSDESQEDEHAEINNETVAEDEDVLDIFGDDADFEDQSVFAESQPKQARTVDANAATTITVPLQQPQSKVQENVQRSFGKPYKIPKLVANNNTQITIQNDLAKHSVPQSVSVARPRATPLQPSTANVSANIINRIPAKQRLGLLSGINPSHLAKAISNASISSKLPTAPTPSTSSASASQIRILQETERLSQQQQQISAKSAVPAAVVKKSIVLKEYAMPSFAINRLENEPVFNVLFQNICRKYIGDKCTQPSACPFSHTLPDLERFRTQLDAFGPGNVNELYDSFVVRSEKLFVRYVSVFCDYFGAHKLESQLVKTVRHCCHPERRLYTYFAQIVDGFVTAGKSYDMALLKLIALIPIPKRNEQINNMLLKLIVDDRIERLDLFYKDLKLIANQDRYVFPIEPTNRLLRIYVNSDPSDEELLFLLWEVLSKISSRTNHSIDQQLLGEFYVKTTLNMGVELPSVPNATARQP